MTDTVQMALGEREVQVALDPCPWEGLGLMAGLKHQHHIPRTLAVHWLRTTIHRFRFRNPCRHLCRKWHMHRSNSHTCLVLRVCITSRYTEWTWTLQMF